MPIVVFEVAQDLPAFNLTAGQRVELDAEDAMTQTLLDAGVIAEASGEAADEAPEEEAPAEEAPVEASLARSLNHKLDKIEKKVGRKVPFLYVPNPDHKVERSGTDMLRSMWKAARGDRKAAQHLRNYKAILGVNETTDESGGFTVNPEYSKEIWSQSVSTPDLQSYCRVVEASSDTYNLRAINQTSLASGSIYGGITVTTASEGGTLTGSTPAWQNIELTLQKYYGFCYFTNEVLSDTSYSLERDINEMMKKAFVMKLNTDLVTGASNPEGILNCPALVTISKESGQASSTILYANLVKMWARLYPDCQDDAVWFVNPEVYRQLLSMTYTTGGTQPAFGLTYDPRNTSQISLFGRPVVALWACSQLGLAGDIILASLKDFHVFRKPMQVDMSKDVEFKTDQVAFRFTFRIGAKNAWRSAVTGATGATTYSNLVVLESRGST